MIWNSDLSVTVKINHVSRQIARENTFDHFYIVRNKADIILNFEARVPRIFEDKVSGACSELYLCYWLSLQTIKYEPFSVTVGLMYASGALTATCAKLRRLSSHSVDHENCRPTSKSHLDVPRRHSVTPALGCTWLQGFQYLDSVKKGKYKHAIDTTSLTSPLWVRE